MMFLTKYSSYYQLDNMRKNTQGELSVSLGNWGTANSKEIKMVLQSVCEILADSGVHVTEAVNIRYKQYPHSPRTLYRRGPDGEHLILLGVNERRWNKLVFQFAHEYFHVFSEHYHVKGDHKFRWIEESFCEAVSLYVLGKMTPKWATDPPVQQWRSYSPQFLAYQKLRTQDVKSFNYSNEFRTWYLSNLEALTKNPNNEKLIQTVSLELLKLIEQNDLLLRSAFCINKISGQADSFSDYMALWKKYNSDETQQAIATFEDVFHP